MEKFIRPKAVVLPRTSLIPSTNLIKPPPDHFTHQLKTDQDYQFDDAKNKKPAGKLRRGTKVLLLSRDEKRCRVADRRGLCIEIDCASSWRS